MEPGGMNISEYGPCPIAVELKVDKNDNNCCWLTLHILILVTDPIHCCNRIMIRSLAL